jgi:hypothetical protein
VKKHIPKQGDVQVDTESSNAFIAIEQYMAKFTYQFKLLGHKPKQHCIKSPELCSLHTHLIITDSVVRLSDGTSSGLIRMKIHITLAYIRPDREQLAL